MHQTLTDHGLKILWQDEHMVVVDKPSGLPSQAGRDGRPGVVELLGSVLPYVALHHRLDQPASGLMALALSKAANPGLARAFRERSAKRTYHAVLGCPVKSTRWTQSVDGKSAQTSVEILGEGSGFCAARLRLHTGRKHQIRLHAAMAGAPVVGDRRHGGEVGRAWPRLALHAARLQLEHPVHGGPIDVVSPIPDDLKMLWRLAGGT
ncbi:MAG: 23S rRNA-/tRNA-specific pseudouridylate synthase [Kiritimatiellia bacterium]|jgi:23S rRNA-/tRNA-specific pseudouridylate synthase